MRRMHPAGSYAVDVHLETDNRKSVSHATPTLLDSNSGEVLDRSRVQSSNFTQAPNRPCTLRVRVDGYSMVERPLNAQSKSVTIPLTSSGVPQALQRLFHR